MSNKPSRSNLTWNFNFRFVLKSHFKLDIFECFSFLLFSFQFFVNGHFSFPIPRKVFWKRSIRFVSIKSKEFITSFQIFCCCNGLDQSPSWMFNFTVCGIVEFEVMVNFWTQIREWIDIKFRWNVNVSIVRT